MGPTVETFPDGAGAHAGPVRVSTVAPGILVATERLPWARSVALSATVLAGSVDERDDQAGAAHLIEHLLFRGSARFGPGEVDRRFDEIGAELSATTDRCRTQLATWVMREHRRPAVEAIADVLWAPLLRDDDLAHEREIVLEELAMVEDAPEDLTFELIGDAVFPGSPLGRPVIGRRATIEALGADDLRAFHRERYAAAPVVWSAAGDVDHDELCAEVAALVPQWRSPDARPPGAAAHAEPAGAPVRLLAARRTEQLHLAVAVPLFGPGPAEQAALKVLDALLGGPPSSRLFQEVRERRGLAYSVGSFLDLQFGFGMLGAYLGTRPDRAGVAAEVLAGELRGVASGAVTADELAWARDHVAGRIGLALETAGGRAAMISSRLCRGFPTFDPADVVAEIAAVDLDAVHRVAAAAFGRLDEAGVACVAPDPAAAAGVLDGAGIGAAAGALETSR